MKNLILAFVKKHEQKNKLDLISELLVSGSVEENIELFNQVKASFLYKMDTEKKKKEREINLITSIKPIRVTDPIFDKPLADLEVDYQIVKPSK